MAYTTQADVESFTNIVFDNAAQAEKMISMATRVVDNYLCLDSGTYTGTLYNGALEKHEQTFEVFAKKCGKFLEVKNPKLNDILEIDGEVVTLIKGKDYVFIGNMIRFCGCSCSPISCGCDKCLGFTTIKVDVGYDPLPVEIEMATVNIVRAIREQVFNTDAISSGQGPLKRITQGPLTKERFEDKATTSGESFAKYLPGMSNYLNVLDKYKIQDVVGDSLGCFIGG